MEQIRLHVDRNNIDAIASAMLVDCTTFIDKKSMVCKCKLTLELSNADIRRVFAQAEQLRNQCAHPGSDSELLKGSVIQLRHAVREIGRVIGVLHETFVRECRVRGLPSGD